MAQVRQTSALRLMEAPTAGSESFSELGPPRSHTTDKFSWARIT